jgi:hypothetical protein
MPQKLKVTKNPEHSKIFSTGKYFQGKGHKYTLNGRLYTIRRFFCVYSVKIKVICDIGRRDENSTTIHWRIESIKTRK